MAFTSMSQGIQLRKILEASPAASTTAFIAESWGSQVRIFTFE
jgi:hypothetical protein